uniref:Myb/SANT-like DNA-binding domain-containing protein n=1 Tax=Anopheles atroparvus TaxID=41427 RepID=A0AAG5CR04_ANOAO
MARRNVWTTEETKELLSVIKDLNLMKYFGEERNHKLYDTAQNELKNRGFTDKDAFQIEHKWKNLKRAYYKTKRENYLIESCEFYEELDELMSSKGTVARKPKASPKRTKPVLESFDILLAKLSKAEKENNEEFTRKEKDLIDYQFELYTQDERQSTSKLSQLLTKNMEDFCAKTQQILVEEGLLDTVVEVAEQPDEGETIDPSIKKEIVKEFYQTWREEETY